MIPCVNPDGVSERSSKTIGQDVMPGIDINRDFDYYWQYSNHPVSTPAILLSARLKQGIKSSSNEEQPDMIIDFHGWLNCTYGDVALTDSFNQAFGTRRIQPNSTDNSYMAQFFTGGPVSMQKCLGEYPSPGTYEKMLALDYSQKTIDVFSNICNEI